MHDLAAVNLVSESKDTEFGGRCWNALSASPRWNWNFLKGRNAPDDRREVSTSVIVAAACRRTCEPCRRRRCRPNAGFLGRPATAARGSGGWCIEPCQLRLRASYSSGTGICKVGFYIWNSASFVSAQKLGRFRWPLPEHTIRISLPCPSWSLPSRLTRPWISADA